MVHFRLFSLAFSSSFVQTTLTINFQTDRVIFIIDGTLSFCVAVPIIVISNIIIVVFVRKHGKNPAVWAENSKSYSLGNEFRFAFVGGLLSISYTLAMSNQIYYFLVYMEVLPDSTTGSNFVYTWYLIFFDLFTLSNPYLLVFLSSLVRRRLLRLLKLKPNDVNVEMPMTGLNNRREQSMQ